MKEQNERGIFPQGGKMPELYSDKFSGRAYLKMLSDGGDEFNCPIGNVTFEPGCRNNWHLHPGGQILLVTGGRGWYQAEGEAARELKAGDVVKIPALKKHWHGAAHDSWFTHLSIETNSQKGAAQWFEPLAEEEYRKLR